MQKKFSVKERAMYVLSFLEVCDMNNKKNAEEILKKMYSDLKNLEEKKKDFSRKLDVINKKIKMQTTSIKNYEEATKLQLLNEILGDNLSVPELRLLAETGKNIGHMMKNIANSNNLPKIVQDISEFCELETQNVVKPESEEE